MHEPAAHSLAQMHYTQRIQCGQHTVFVFGLWCETSTCVTLGIYACTLARKHTIIDVCVSAVRAFAQIIRRTAAAAAALACDHVRTSRVQITL